MTIRIEAVDNATVEITPEVRLGSSWGPYQAAIKSAGARNAKDDRGAWHSTAPLERSAEIEAALRHLGFAVSIGPGLAACRDQNEDPSGGLATHEALIREIEETTGMRLFPFQREGVAWLTTKHRALLLDQMGCVEGDAVVRVCRAGRSFEMPLHELHRRFNGGTKWDLSIPTMIRALCGDTFRLHPINAVFDRGIRPVLRVVTDGGKMLRVTADHEVGVGPDFFRRADELRPGDEILTNGRPVCGRCGGTTNVVSNPYAKFRGLCRKCIYRHARAKPTWKGGRFVDDDGYVRVSGQWDHPRASHGTVYEHVLVMERHLGRFVTRDEVVHHRDENKQNNEIGNLEHCSSNSEHMAEHGRTRGFRHLDGGRSAKGGLVIFVPKVERIVSIEPDGKAHVYDVVCEDPHRNFVANGIVVHNCGKTIQALAALPEGARTIVVCPAAVKAVWLREANRFRPELDTFVCKGRGSFRWPEPGEVVILNYELLPDVVPEGCPRELTLIADECFTGETVVKTPNGDRRIDSVRSGDRVLAHDGTVQVVEAAWSSVPSETFKVVLGMHGLYCTGNHPFLTDRGWRRADALHEGDLVVRVVLSEDREGEVLSPEVQERVVGEAELRVLLEATSEDPRSPFLREGVFGEVANESTRDQGQGLHAGGQGEKFRQPPSVERGAPGAGSDLGPEDEVEEPDAFGKRSSEGFRQAEDDGTSAAVSGGQRATDLDAAGEARCRARMGVRVRNSNGDETSSLQDRHREPQHDGGRGSRRGDAQHLEGSGGGRTQDGFPREYRLARVARVERGRTPADGYDGRVYNLQVSGPHTYLIGAGVSGFVVHNCHAFKNFKAIRTLRFRSLGKSVRAAGGRSWLLTGTPLTNRPPDLWGVLQAAGLAEATFGSWPFFAECFGGYQRYVTATRKVWEWGTPRADEVAGRLRAVSLRRHKADVLPDLPAKRYEILTETELAAKDRKALDAVWAEIEKAGLGADEETGRKKLPSFEGMSEARAILAKAKLPLLEAIVESHEEEGEPLVVWSAHKAPVEAIGARPGWGLLTGDVSLEERSRLVTSFQAGELKGLACTIQAAGVGLTMTAACHEVFIDLDWTPAMNEQAEDRIHRIGQANAVLVTVLAIDHPLEARILELCAWKKGIFEVTVGASANYRAKVPTAEELVKRDAEKKERKPRPPEGEVELWAAAALSALSGMDPDGAREVNAAGWNRIDGPFGHRLATQLWRGLSDGQWKAAIRMVRKYHRQIGRCPEEQAT